MITGIINLFILLLIVHYVIYLLRVPANKWTELLRMIVEPVLNVVRALMKQYLPVLSGYGIDWSPFVLFVALKIVTWVLGLFSGLPLIGWLF